VTCTAVHTGAVQSFAHAAPGEETLKHQLTCRGCQLLCANAGGGGGGAAGGGLASLLGDLMGSLGEPGAAPRDRAVVEEVLEPGAELAALEELPEAEAQQWRALLEADMQRLGGQQQQRELSEVYLAGVPGGRGGSSLLAALGGGDDA
jgi:hypothetical protein